MPSGYTAKIHDGKPQSFTEFALDCARGMGAAIHQRDQGSGPISKRVVDGFYYENLAQAEERNREVGARSDAEWNTLYSQEVARVHSENAKIRRENAEMADRYNAMLSKVEAWSPPTAEHEGLKKVMLFQLTESIRFDVHDYQIPVPPSFTVWQAQQEVSAAKQVADHAKYLAEEIERVESQNKWVDDLIASLPDEKEEK